MNKGREKEKNNPRRKIMSQLPENNHALEFLRYQDGVTSVAYMYEVENTRLEE